MPVPTPHLRRGAPIALLVAVLVLALLPAAAAADPVPGGSAGVTAQGDGRSPGTGPAGGPLAIEYVGPALGLDGSGLGGGSEQVIRDHLGQVLFWGPDAETGAEVLVAVDPDDGTVVWSLAGVHRGCTPVASDAHVYVSVDETSPALANGRGGILEVDPADGSVVRTWDDPILEFPGEPDETGWRGCEGDLVLAGDVLVAPNSRTFDAWLTAFDLSGADIAIAWEDYYDGWESDYTGRAAASVDGSLVHFAHSRQIGADDGPVLTTYDAATGDVRSSTPLATAPDAYAAVPDGLVVALRGVQGFGDDPGQPERLARYEHAADGTGMAEVWTVAYDRDADLDESGLGYWIGELAIAGDTLVTREPGGIPVFAVDLTDGSPLWQTSAGGTSTNRGLTIDGAGIAWTSGFAGGGPSVTGLEIETGAVVASVEDPFDLWGDAGVGAAAGLVPLVEDGRILLHDRSAGMRLASLIQDEPVLVDPPDRIGGDTPGDVAVQICQLLFPDDGTAGAVLLARDDVFADALAGAPLAGDDACILFTDGGPDAPLRADVLAEVQRALPPGGRVEILGGVSAVSTTAEQSLQAEGYQTTRYAGASRYETAGLIATEVLVRTPGTRMLLATGDAFPDSVLGGSFGGATDTPILLTSSDPSQPLHPAVQAVLDGGGINQTVVLGGTAAVPAGAAAQAPGVQRVEGPNRFATAVGIARTLWPEVIGQPAPEDRRFVVVDLSNERGGDAWTYALASAPLAARLGAPQLGVEPARLPAETSDYLAAIGFDTPPDLTVIGGVAVVSEQVVTAIQQGG